MVVINKQVLPFKDYYKLKPELEKHTDLFKNPFFYYERNKIFQQLDKQSSTQIVPFLQEEYEQTKSFLLKKGLPFEEENLDVKTCCDISTANLQQIVFSYEFSPGDVAVHNGVYSKTPVWGILFRAYMVNFGREEEKLQKLLVEHDIEVGKWPESNSSSFFSIFKSQEEAQKYVTQENKEYLDENGNLKEGLLLLGGLTKIRALHSDGTTIVCSSDTRSLPLEKYYDSNNGFIADLGLNSYNYHNIHRITACPNCEQDKTIELKNTILEKIKNYDGWGFDLKPNKSYGANYTPNLDNVRILLESRMNTFE